MTQDGATPPPNGFTRFMRRFISVISFFLFIGLIIADALGFLVNSVPMAIMGALLLAALQFFDQIYEVFRIFGGRK